ncbi:MAG TPA: hypothetical protein VGO93_23485 [Candidatus Xenobia bacterium]|jgi:hypothetical protein
MPLSKHAADNLQDITFPACLPMFREADIQGVHRPLLAIFDMPHRRAVRLCQGYALKHTVDGDIEEDIPTPWPALMEAWKAVASGQPWPDPLMDAKTGLPVRNQFGQVRRPQGSLHRMQIEAMGLLERWWQTNHIDSVEQIREGYEHLEKQWEAKRTGYAPNRRCVMPPPHECDDVHPVGRSDQAENDKKITTAMASLWIGRTESPDKTELSRKSGVGRKTCDRYLGRYEAAIDTVRGMTFEKRNAWLQRLVG